MLNEEISKKLISSGLTRIQISIDATNQQTYDKVRPGGDYNKIIKNVHNFIKLRNDLKKSSIDKGKFCKNRTKS